jgi:hypothetical protein
MSRKQDIPQNETREEKAERLVTSSIKRRTEQSRVLRTKLRRHAPTLSPTQRKLTIDYLERDHALTMAAVRDAEEMPEFSLMPDWGQDDE